MARFINKRNGRIVELLEEQKKGGQLISVSVRYEDDGKDTGFSASTWHRWWRALEEEEDIVQEVMQQKKDLGIEVLPIESIEIVEETAGDGTPYSQVLEEIQHDEKVAAEKKQAKKSSTPKKAPTKKRVQNEQVPDILAYIDEQANELGMTFYIRDKQPSLINYKRETGKVVFMLRKTYDKVEFYAKSKTLNKKVEEKFDAANGFYDRKLAIDTLNDNTKQLINSIIDSYKEV